MSKVSVIIPVYNVESYLPRCIDSVRNQTEKDIEIILVDDGSTDACGKICDRYAEKDSRIKVIHQQNGGLGAARNTGIQAAISPYILFADSDDYVDVDLVEKAYRAAEAHKADIVMFGYNRVHEDGRVDYSYNLPESLTNQKSCSLEMCPELLTATPSAWNKLYKTCLFDGVYFPPRAWYEDLQTIPKLYLKAQSIYCMADFHPYQYLLRENSIMQNGNAEKTATQRIAATDEILNFFQSRGLFESYKNELIWLYCFHGFFLPCREIMNFSGDTLPFLKLLRKNLTLHFTEEQVFANPYLPRLTKKERLIFTLLYKEQYALLRFLLHSYHLLKK